MVGDGLDLVVEDVPIPVDRLAADGGLEGEAVVGDPDFEPGVYRMCWVSQRKINSLSQARSRSAVESARRLIGSIRSTRTASRLATT